jgi:hypothetical protein
MRRTLKIFALILLYFLACGKSCDNEEQNDTRREQRRITAESDSLRSVFTSDTLSAVSLRAYMESAKQKLLDYSDYLKIVNDTASAEQFRNKAREMISSLFLPGKETGKENVLVSPDSVYTNEVFHRINDSVYRGTLAYSFKNLHQAEKVGNKSAGKGIIEVHLIKGDKNFGKGKFRVWNVYLGKTE